MARGSIILRKIGLRQILYHFTYLRNLETPREGDGTVAARGGGFGKGLEEGQRYRLPGISQSRDVMYQLTIANAGLGYTGKMFRE